MKSYFWVSLSIVIALAITVTFMLGREYLDTSHCPKPTRAELHERLYSIMQIADKYLTMYNVPYTITAGTLLGAIRDSGIISHDDDIDIDVYGEDRDTRVQEAMNQLVTDHKGKFAFYPFFFGYKLVDLAHWRSDCQESGAQIDIIRRLPDHKGGFKLNNKSCRAWPKECNVPDTDVFPITRGMFGPIKVNMPSEPEKLVEQMYGHDWHTPKKFNFHGRYT
jgi:hypothetical protein